MLIPALLGLYVALSVLLFDPKLATFGDNARYLILGKSLAEGTGYRDVHLPGTPAHTQYPPGFPLMLAAVNLVFGGVNVLAAKLFVLFTGIAAMLLTYRLCERVLREKAWPVMATLASVPALIVNNHWVLSEMPFLLVLVGALYCLVLADQRPKAVADRLRLGACALAVATCFIRSAGVAVVLGLALLFLARRQYRNLVVLLALFAATAVPWQVINARSGSEQPYFEQLLAKHPYFLEQGRASLGDWALRVWQNLRDYVARAYPRTLCPTQPNSGSETIIGIVLSLLSAIGLIRGFKKHGILASCALCAVPVLVCWPHIWVTERFLLPFLPLAVVFLFLGADWVAARLRWHWLAPMLAVAIVLVNAVQITALARGAVRDNFGYLRGDRYSGYPIDWRHCFETMEWIKANVPEQAVVLARKPEFVYLLSGRRSFCYPITEDRTQVMSALQRSQYILLDNFQWSDLTPRLIGPILRDNPDLWEIVFTTAPPKFHVARIKPGVQPTNPPPSSEYP
ncbi:phospholipid carrier-dependent glycosyltransferase [candidate division WOR-3 bacterium]|uniref:Phospholipid carrier-dependent glycosyltransferase n=1 Tax=candidate division WOR-3 bacterium TaxID=2052148 RepID=A0A937XGN8_UNCW3|nr:phospholipid carrier-dependent glycosyltransferase [candidate division WOR-3 bacterium]